MRVQKIWVFFVNMNQDLQVYAFGKCISLLTTVQTMASLPTGKVWVCTDIVVVIVAVLVNMGYKTRYITKYDSVVVAFIIINNNPLMECKSDMQLYLLAR